MSELDLTVSLGVVDAVVAETATYGIRRLETGGFLMALVGQEEVVSLAVAGNVGIVRRHNLFQISERALDRLFNYAGDEGLWLPVQFHSHDYGPPEMSIADQNHGLRVEGFVSTILPDFARPPSDLAAWGWWQFSQGSWRPSPPARLIAGAVPTIVTFDEDGVCER